MIKLRSHLSSTQSALGLNYSSSKQRSRVLLFFEHSASTTGCVGQRLREASKINQSLSALSEVIKALSEGLDSGTGGHSFIPYRNSALTWLLKESLGGNARTFMIACISPSATSYQETVGTLNYVARARKIRCKPKINEAFEAEGMLITQLRSQIERLENELKEARRNDLRVVQKERKVADSMPLPSSTSAADKNEDGLQETNMDELYAAQLETQKRAALQSLKRRRYRRVEESANGIGIGNEAPATANEEVPLFEVLTKEIKFWKERFDKREVETKRKLQKLQTNTSLVVARCSELERELELARKTNEDTQNLSRSREATLHEEVQGKTFQLVQMERRVAELEDVQAELRSELALTKTAKEELKRELRDAETLRLKTEQSQQQERVDLEAELGTVSHALEAAQAYQVDLESHLKSVREEVEEERAKARVSIAELEKSRANEAGLRKEVEQQRSRRTEQVEADRAAHVAAVREASMKASNAQSEKESLVLEFEQYKDRTRLELAELRQRLHQQGQDFEALQKELVSQQQHALGALQTERKKSADALQHQLASVQTLEARVTAQEAKVGACTQELETMNNLNEALRVKLRKREEKLESISALNTALQSEIEDLESLAQTLKTESQKHVEETTTVKEALQADFQRRIDNFQTANKTLIIDSQKRVDALREENRMLQVEANKRVQEMQGRIEAANRERDEQAAEATMLQDRLSSVYKEFARLRSDLKATAKEKKKNKRVKSQEDKENNSTFLGSDGGASGQIEALRLRASKAEHNCREATLKLAEVTVELENRMASVKTVLQTERKSFQMKIKELKRQLRDAKGFAGRGELTTL